MPRNVGIELCALNLWRELQRPCDKGCKLPACDGGVGMAFPVPAAVDDPILASVWMISSAQCPSVSGKTGPAASAGQQSDNTIATVRSRPQMRLFRFFIVIDLFS